MSQNKIRFLEEAIQENTTDAFPYFALAKELEKNNQPERALENYTHLVSHFPEYGGTYYHYVLLLVHLGKTEEALTILEKGLTVLQSADESNLYQELLALKNQLITH